MRSKRIQNHIGESRLLLPVSLLITCGLWWLPRRPYTHWELGALAACLLTSYLITEMNNRNALIRVYSRSVCSVFLLLVGSMGVLHGWSWPWVAVPALVASLFLLTRIDGVGNTVVHTYHIFVVLGVASLFSPYYIWFGLILYWHIAATFRKLTFKGFFAGIIGLATPIWVALCTCLLTDRWTMVEQWWNELTNLRSITAEAFARVDTGVLACWGLLTVMLATGSVHYLLNSYEDKVRTRHLIYMLMTQSAFTLVLAALQPHWAPGLLPVMVVSASVLPAHYLTLQRTWWASNVLWLFIICLISLAVYTCLPEAKELITELIK